MSKSKALVERFINEEEAGSAVEYGMIAAVIAVALIVVLVAFRDRLVGMFNATSGAMQGAQ
jgi:Flp pilus assembly pilin Flp